MEMKSFEETVDVLYSLQSNAATMKQWINERRSNPNTSRLADVEAALKIVGVDVDKQSIIHVAGTKGKGSTSAFAEGILREYGYSTGLFTSPHLVNVCERIRLNGKPIAKDKFKHYFWDVYNALDSRRKLQVDGAPSLPFFHFMTVLAYKIFQEEGVDVSIIEVGIGGRGDATNVCSHPIVTGIATLDYDHMNVLGDTIEEIAMEKAGIMKKGVPAYTSPQWSNAMNVLEEKSREHGAAFLTVVNGLSSGGLVGSVLKRRGDHQLLNAALAVQLAAEWLRSSGKGNEADISALPPRTLALSRSAPSSSACTDSSSHISSGYVELPEQFQKGLINTRWPGRSHICKAPHALPNTTLYLDGAHTPHSMEVCSRWMIQCYEAQHRPIPPSSSPRAECRDKSCKRVLVYGCRVNKDPSDLMAPLFPMMKNHISFDHVIFTTISLNGQEKIGKLSLEHDENHVARLKAYWLETARPNGKQEVCATYCITEAVEEIKRIRSENNIETHLHVFVCGSLYVVGGMMEILSIPIDSYEPIPI